MNSRLLVQHKELIQVIIFFSLVFSFCGTIFVIVMGTSGHEQAVMILYVVESCSDFTVLNETPLEQPTFEYFNTIWDSPTSYWLLKECVSTINSFCLEEWTDVISYFQNLTNDHEKWLAHSKERHVCVSNAPHEFIGTTSFHEKILFVFDIMDYFIIIIKVEEQINFR